MEDSSVKPGMRVLATEIWSYLGESQKNIQLGFIRPSGTHVVSQWDKP